MDILCSITWADIGLALDIVGALLIYFYALDSPNMIVAVADNPALAWRKKWLSIFGICLLVTGFAMQAIGNHFPDTFCS